MVSERARGVRPAPPRGGARVFAPWRALLVVHRRTGHQVAEGHGERRCCACPAGTDGGGAGGAGRAGGRGTGGRGGTGRGEGGTQTAGEGGAGPSRQRVVYFEMDVPAAAGAPRQSSTVSSDSKNAAASASGRGTASSTAQ